MKRFNNISIYRIIATICVLQFHIFYILYARAIPYEMLLSKGVQGLTALSGFLYSQKLITDKKKFYFGNLIKLMIPALIVVAFIASWDVIYMAINNSWDWMIFATHRAYGGRIITQVDNYYYLAYIIICYLITPVLQRNDKWSIVAVVSVIAIEVAVGFFFGPAMIAVTYVIGYYVGKKWFKTFTNPEERFSFKALGLWALILLASIGAYILIQTYSFGDAYFLKHLHDIVNNIIVTTFGVATLFFMLMVLKPLNKFKGLPLFKYTDKLALIIYLMNQAFMCGAMNITRWVEPMWLVTILIYAFTIISSILLLFISELVLKSISKRPQKVIINEQKS